MHQVVVASIVLLALSANTGFAGGGTALTYQGRLLDAGEPANGLFDFEFGLWDEVNGGNPVGVPQVLNNTPVADGLFTVQIDFGADAFDNSDRWLEISVDGVPLSPRQPITRAPYAIQTRGILVDDNQLVGMGVSPGSTRLRVWNFAGGGAFEAVSSDRAIEAITTEGDMAILASNQSADGMGVFAQHQPSQNQGWLGTPDYGVYGRANDVDNDWAGYFLGRAHVSDRLFVGREDPIISTEYFGFNAPVGDGQFGGMYISTNTQGGRPFYGYAAGGNIDMWHYYDGATGKWHVDNGGDVRLTITDTGSVGIGTISPAFLLHVNGSAGKPGGGSWSNASDRRLKKNIQDIDGALDSLLKLRGVTFEYIDAKSINELEGERIGVIAQEVQQVFPDWIGERDDGYKTVTFRGFEAMTVEALRELRNEKDRQVARLEGKNKELQSTQIAHRQQIAILNSDNEALRQRLSNLESIVSELNAQEK